jgi:hypothetical protein
MRVQELYEQVAGLGFEKSLEDEEWFYQAANRALLQVNYLRPAISSYVINHKPMKNLVEGSFTPIERSEDLIYETENAKAYYFQADGIGTVFVERFDTNSKSWVTVDVINMTGARRFSTYYGFIRDGRKPIEGQVRLRFAGEYLYSVKNVAMYEHLYSDDVADIPAYEAYTRYDMTTLADDFLALSTPPITEDEEYERLSGDYDVEGGRVILLPYSVTGCFKVLYNRKPRALIYNGSAQDDESVLDLDEELCSLIPLLIASYIWLEDEPDRAQYYYSQYQARAGEILAREKNLSPVQYKSCNGW